MNSDYKDYTWHNEYLDYKGVQYRGHWFKTHDQTSVPNGIGEILYSDNSIYQGQVKDGIPVGMGRMTHSDGDVY